MALIRYCQGTHATRKPIQTALAETEKKLQAAETLASDEQAKVLELQAVNKKLGLDQNQVQSLKAEVERLRDVEQELEAYRRLNVRAKDLETFVTYKSAIRYQLELVPKLVECVGSIHIL